MYKYYSEFEQVDCPDKSRVRNKLTFDGGCWRFRTISADYDYHSPIELKSEGSCKINYYCL